MEKRLFKKTLSVSLFALLSVVLFSACKPSDAKLQQNVQNALVSAYPTVSASVNKGVVTLSGVVNSQAMKSGAESVAMTVKDIKSVNNNITVNEPAPVVKINPDTEISQNVTNALKAGGFDKVNVSIQNGEITLTGEVKRADLQKVMQIANESNPKKVINQLTIK